MDTPSILRSKLEELAQNLSWSWHPEVTGIFEDMDPALWRRVNHNPMAFLREVSDARINERARSSALESRIFSASRRLQNYLNAPDTWGATYAGVLKANPIAYFSAEFGLHESVPLYSGGLGVLAGDHLKSASDLDVPVCGVGLFYAQGYFTQRLDPSGWQQEEFGNTDLSTLPVEKVTDDAGNDLMVQVRSGETPISLSIWRAQVGRNQLLLLDSDVEGNKPEHREITSRLYWGDQDNRVLQEIVLGIGGLRALRTMGVRPGVFHLNEGHSSFALLEAVRQEREENGCNLEDAMHRVGRRSLFTTHTPVPAGHDRFPKDMVERHLGWMREALGMDESSFLALGRVDPQNDHETFCMTVLALKLAYRANGVASLHGDVSRRMWKDLWPNHRISEVPIGHITNGVHTRSWMAPEVARALQRRLGIDWMRRTSRKDLWRGVAGFSDLELWETHQVLKARLIDFIRHRYREQELRKGVESGLVEHRAERLMDPAALTIGFARRFATYKRATLVFDDIERLAKLMGNPDRPVQIVFAGKSHPKDEGGKKLIQDIVRLQHDSPFEGKIAFIENYDINVGRHLVQGVDVWLNTPVRPEEACGTSGMKAVLNGALNLSIRDGWWAESFDGHNGFEIPSAGPSEDLNVQRKRDHEALMRVLEHEVIPMFFERDDSHMPSQWLDRVRRAFMTLAWRFSADRMVMDYALKAYVPCAMGDTSYMP